MNTKTNLKIHNLRKGKSVPCLRFSPWGSKCFQLFRHFRFLATSSGLESLPTFDSVLSRLLEGEKKMQVNRSSLSANRSLSLSLCRITCCVVLSLSLLCRMTSSIFYQLGWPRIFILPCGIFFSYIFILK